MWTGSTCCTGAATSRRSRAARKPSNARRSWTTARSGSRSYPDPSHNSRCERLLIHPPYEWRLWTPEYTFGNDILGGHTAIESDHLADGCNPPPLRVEDAEGVALGGIAGRPQECGAVFAAAQPETGRPISVGLAIEQTCS